MHKNFNMMKRYAIPLVKTFGSAALSNVRMNLSASHTRMLFSIVAIAMMMLAPSAVKAAYITTEYSFGAAATVAYNHIAQDANKYDAQIVMTDRDHNVGWGAKYADKIRYKNNRSFYEEFDISRLAFTVNTNGNGRDDNGDYGFYLRRDKTYNKAGLYTGYRGSRLAVLNLRPGDKVTFTYSGASECGTDANLQNITYGGWFNQIAKGQTSTYTVNISSVCDFVVAANRGTVIESIKIESLVADYDIQTTTVNNQTKTTFEFTGNGTLAENDFAIPNMSVSFGNAEDYLVVQGLQSHMYNKDTGKETLVKGSDTRPIGGNFYAFKPTGSGTLNVEGGIHGSCVHLFVWDENNNGWITDGEHWYKETYNTDNDHYIDFNIDVVKDRIYYICINDLDANELNNGDPNAFHLHKFTFTHTFKVEQLAKVVDLEKDVANGWIQLTKIENAGGYDIKVKSCTANISPTIETKIEHDYLYMRAPQFVEGTDNAGTVIFDVKTDGGDIVFVATFPYHASFNDVENPDPNRTYGHTWNFIDPRHSDSNIGNCLMRNGLAGFITGETTGVLSIGQFKNTNSTLYYETQNREWTYSQRQTGSAGGFHDPYYANVWDMEGDNADMIWETEGLWFETGTNLSCIHNEKNALAWNADPLEQKGNPVNFKTLQLVDDSGNPKTTTDNDGKTVEVNEDPDRYVGLLPDPNGKSSFTIPALKDGDRVLIFMKSGEATGSNGIFLNVHGALDAEGTPINENDQYKAGGTNWIHSRYEGCYHFIKNGDGDMKFDMVDGSMCKLMYIRIYQGKRIDTNDIVSTKYIDNGDGTTTKDAGHLLFINDKGATKGDYSQFSEHYSGKGQNADFKVLTYSGSLNASSFTGNNFKIGGTYNNLLDFTSTVGEMGVFRLRVKDLTYTYTNDANQNKNYVADLCDRNFTVGYRDKVDYPYTWDFTDVKTYSGGKITTEANKYVETNNKYENTGWDISLFDKNGNMKVNSGVDPSAENQIFSADKAGFGNQLWADDGVIAETRGLWFYTDDNNPQYNDCMQITAEGIRFANTKVGSHTPNWNYKMVVPSVPKDGAVYVRMKRDSNVKDDDVLNGTPFLATKFHFGVATADEKTSVSTGTDVINGIGNSSSKYSFYKVPDTDDEYILAVLNTGDANNLTFTLNGWMVEKVAVSTDQKSVNVKGWTTESRDHVIDPELTAYMTGKDIETCLVTDVDYNNKTVTLTRMDNTQVMTKLADGKNGANIIHNKANEEIKILNNGFHLFVPDMHDYDKANDANGEKTITGKTSMLIAQVSNTNGDKSIPASSTKDGVNYTNYALTYKYYKLDENGNKTGSQIEGDEAFYRIATGGASSSGNQGYLPLQTSEVKPKDNGTSAKYGFTFVFEDYQEIPTEVLAPETFETSERVENNVFYNLNGQKLNGLPTKSGLYIMNGKKVIIK